jgi:leader peptidase (prepilin peptidase)/N-methyltransferase
MELIVVLLGLAVGSFLNVLIDRLPLGENVLIGRSRCDHCHKTLRWFELVPLLSFVLGRGHCRRCQGKLSLQYPAVEGITGAGFLMLFLSVYSGNHQPLVLLGALLVCCSLIVIFVADYKYQIIPDSMIVLGAIGVIGAIGGIRGVGGLAANAWSALAAGAFFLALWAATRGRGMGLGDVKLAVLMGLLLGYPAIIVALYLAFLTGAVTGVILILSGKKKVREHIPFGPFLVAGTVIALAYGDRISAWWMKLV